MTHPAASAPGTGSRRPVWRLHALVAAIILAGAGCAAAGYLVPGALDEPPALWRLTLAALVFLVGDSAVVHLRFGHDTYTFTWSEASIILGLFLVPWPWLSIVSPLSVAVVHAVARRDPVKIAFNAASMAVGATLAQATFTVLTRGREVHDTLLACALLTAAACLYFLWNSLTVSAAIALSRGLPVRKVVREGLTLKLAVLGGNTIVALLLITAEWRGSTVVLIPFSVAMLYLAYRGYLRALEERDVWRQLDRTAKEISLLDEGDVAAAAVARAAELFKADVVELAVVPPDDAPVQVVVHTSEGTRTLREEPRHTIQPGTQASSSVCLPPTTGSATTWVVTPLEGINGLAGSLRLGFHGPAVFSERQQKVLTTFLHGVSMSLQNARLYGQMRRLADRYAREARHDMLTGLPNRKLFYERAVAELARSGRDGTNVGLLLIDLDHFKEINDTLGHGAGDEVLRAVANRLTNAMRPSDLVARLGGDEFAVLLSGIPAPDAADLVACALLPVLAEPIHHDGRRLAVEGSIGVACYPHDGSTVADLLRRADVAMYQAKETRGVFARYRSDRDDSSVNRMTLVADLHQAISADQFILHFQPQVDLHTGRVVSAEVLTRWQHPTLGLLGPDEFISAAEQSGLIREFTLHILDRAVAECATWRHNGVDAPISVNLSARNLLDRGLPADVTHILKRHDLPADQLILEITETTVISDDEAVHHVLTGLRRTGVELSVDDFGTGYSSLSLLQRIAVNEIKIDRSFVQAMTASDGDAAIVRATIELAHSLGLRVVAEGVETPEHVTALRALGCDLAQGWHFGRACDSNQMRNLLGLRWATVPPRRPAPAPRRPVADRDLRTITAHGEARGRP